MSKRALIVTLVVTTLALTGCKGHVFQKEELMGQWQMQPQDIQHSGVRDGGTPKIAFGRDGNFSATSIPAEMIQIGALSHEASLSGKGTWAIISMSDGQRLLMNFTSIDGSDLPYGSELFMRKKHGETQLYYFEGDPDEQQEIHFERTSSSMN